MIYTDYEYKSKKKQPPPVCSDFCHLCRYLEKHFYELMKTYHAEDRFKINKLGASRADLFLDGCLDILETNDDFVFIDEEETKKYVCGRMRKAMRRFAMRNYREPLSLGMDEIKLDALLIHFGCRTLI